MPLVNVMVNSRAYTIACDGGEEDHLKELAGHVDEKVRELVSTVGQVGDQKLLLMASVLIADELHEANSRLEAHLKQLGALSGSHQEIDRRLHLAETGAADAEQRASRAIEDIRNRAAAELAAAEQRAAQMIDSTAERLERLAGRLSAA